MNCRRETTMSVFVCKQANYSLDKRMPHGSGDHQPGRKTPTSARSGRIFCNYDGPLQSHQIERLGPLIFAMARPIRPESFYGHARTLAMETPDTNNSTPRRAGFMTSAAETRSEEAWGSKPKIAWERREAYTAAVPSASGSIAQQKEKASALAAIPHELPPFEWPATANALAKTGQTWGENPGQFIKKSKDSMQRHKMLQA